MTATVKADERLKLMVQLCEGHGMPKDQTRNLSKAGYVVLEQMMDFHAAAREADLKDGPDEIALAGTRGPGKSFAVMQQVGNDDCIRYPGLKWLFLRKIMKSAAESLDDLTRKAFAYTPHKVTGMGVEFLNGSRVVIGGYKDPRDIEKYLGIEYDGIVIEEATQFTEEKKQKIRGSMRSSIWKPRVYLTTNADGIGLAWFKRDFVLPARQRKEKYTRFFDVTYKENPFLDASYVRWLEGLRGPLGKAWRDADWDAFAGMAFPSWDYDRHVIELKDAFEIPQHWIKWVAIDWGYAAPFCALWLTKNPDTRRVYVYREAYQANLTSRQQARIIQDMTPPAEKISLYYADPALWERNVHKEEVFTTADEYKSEGLHLTKGDNDRIGGMRKLHTLLANLPDGEPGVQFFEVCRHLVEQMSTLALNDITSGKLAEDVNTEQEDHAFDALKYGLSNEKKVSTKPPDPNKGRNPSERYRSML